MRGASLAPLMPGTRARFDSRELGVRCARRPSRGDADNVPRAGGKSDARGHVLLERAEEGLEIRRRGATGTGTAEGLVADHGARVYGKQEIPLRTYEIPMLIYSPKHVVPRRVDGLMNQVDIAPTLLGMLGLPYRAPWFGRDVFNSPEAGRVAFFSHNHDVALLRDGELRVLGMQQRILRKRYDAATDHNEDSEAASPELDDLAIAYYQTAYDLFSERKLEAGP